MEPGARPERAPTGTPLNEERPLEVRKDRPTPASGPQRDLGPAPHFEARQHRPTPRPGDHPFAAPSVVDARTARPDAKPAAPLTNPPTPAARTLRPDDRFSPWLASPTIPPAKTPRPAAPADPPAPAAPRPVETRHDTRTPPARDGNAVFTPSEFEVRRDVPQHTALPPLPTTAGEVVVESDAGRSRVRVMTTGVFDLLHLGHVHMLDAARKLGDELYVVIARDETVRKLKHEPLNPEAVRRELVQALKPVTKALLGRHGDIYAIVEEIRPDVIALGFDQKFSDEEVRAKCAQHGVPVRVARLPEFDHDLDATRKIIDRIADRIQKKELYTQRGG